MKPVLVLVAGGGGLYSAVMPTWCAGAHRNPAISVEVDLGQACEVPAPPPARTAEATAP